MLNIIKKSFVDSSLHKNEAGKEKKQNHIFDHKLSRELNSDSIKKWMNTLKKRLFFIKMFMSSPFPAQTSS